MMNLKSTKFLFLLVFFNSFGFGAEHEGGSVYQLTLTPDQVGWSYPSGQIVLNHHQITLTVPLPDTKKNRLTLKLREKEIKGLNLPFSQFEGLLDIVKDYCDSKHFVGETGSLGVTGPNGQMAFIPVGLQEVPVEKVRVFYQLTGGQKKELSFPCHARMEGNYDEQE